MTVLLIVLAIIYIICMIITFSYAFVELTLDADGLVLTLLGTFIAIVGGILWPVVLVVSFVIREE